MELDIIKQILSERGIVYSLFFLIVGGGAWKGIPFVITKFGEILKEQNETYKESLKEISGTFTFYFERSMEWHSKHSEQLNRVETSVNSILNKK